MGKKTQKILIIDDNREQIKLLIELLKKDYQLVAATGGAKGLELAKKIPQPDLILLDVKMKPMNGHEVCRRLKMEMMTRHLPVILMTGEIDKEDELRGLALGAIDYVRKPFMGEVIKLRIKNHLTFKIHSDNLRLEALDRSKELIMTQSLLIESLAILAEFKDPETGAHIKRTQNYMKVLAKQLQRDPSFTEELSDENIEWLHHSAPLHDIGKVGIPDRILLKSGSLSKEEMDIIKLHTTYGYDVLKKTMEKLPDKSFLTYATEIAFSHHEKWDGSGYPQGLKGDQIPLSARLMALADVYDALVSKRSYKEPLSHKEAFRIIACDNASHFDPQIRDAFIMIEETFENIAHNYDDIAEEEDPTDHNDDTSKNILLVDDNEINLEIMKNQIESIGYSVTIANGGRQAMKEMEIRPFDLVVSDLDMPDLDGYQLVKEIRKLNPRLPVMAVTASDYSANIKSLEKQGFNSFLLKPFNNRDFKKKLTTLWNLDKIGVI